MEAAKEAQPKRKYVMTPEHRAKVMANLAQARLAPKEKVYRKTPKRYAANLNNLGIANAKRREEAETLQAKMEDLFPPSEADLPPLTSLPPLAGAPPRRMPPSFFLDPFDEATRLIGKRLRKVHAAVRREGRRIMRLLTAAMKRSQPLSVDEALDLARRLLKCLDGARVTEEAGRLNRKIGHLLGKMIEVRYGVEPGAVPVELWLEQLREDRRARAAARRRGREASKAQEAQQVQASEKGGSGFGVGVSGSAKEDGQSTTVVCESQVPNPESGSSAKPESPTPNPAPAVLSLPRTEEEFGKLVARALDLEDAPGVAEVLSGALWERLHMWNRQAQRETRALDRLFDKGANNPPDGFPDPYKELRGRGFDIPLILELDKDFHRWMEELNKRVERALDWWVSMIPSIQQRRASRPVEFPAKPPAGATSEQSVSDSTSRSTAA